MFSKACSSVDKCRWLWPMVRIFFMAKQFWNSATQNVESGDTIIIFLLKLTFYSFLSQVSLSKSESTMVYLGLQCRKPTMVCLL